MTIINQQIVPAAAISNLAPKARLVLCGAVFDYSNEKPVPGPSNLFELITKEATMQGFLTHRQEDRREQGIDQMVKWINEGKIRNIEYMLHGIENTGKAFCDMLMGLNFGKTIVRLVDDDGVS